MGGEETDKWPSRVVDRHDQGWHLTAGADGDQVRYEADYGFKRDLTGMTLDELRAERGPLKPVEAPTNAEMAEVEQLLELAGRQAVLSLAAGLEVVVHERRAALMAAGMSVSDSYEPSMRSVLAGRAGSWESELLKDVVLIGNGHNLVRANGRDYQSVEEMRAAGPLRLLDSTAWRLHRSGPEPVDVSVWRHVGVRPGCELLAFSAPQRRTGGTFAL